MLISIKTVLHFDKHTNQTLRGGEAGEGGKRWWSD